MLAASAHAQVSLFSQNFDGYTVGSNVPAGTGQSFSNVTGAFPVANTAGLFPAASSGSATAGGDAARFNELNVVTNLNIATVPEPST